MPANYGQGDNVIVHISDRLDQFEQADYPQIRVIESLKTCILNINVTRREKWTTVVVTVWYPVPEMIAAHPDRVIAIERTLRHAVLRFKGGGTWNPSKHQITVKIRPEVKAKDYSTLVGLVDTLAAFDGLPDWLPPLTPADIDRMIGINLNAARTAICKMVTA